MHATPTSAQSPFANVETREASRVCVICPTRTEETGLKEIVMKNLSKILKEAEVGTIYKIEVMEDKNVKMTVTFPDGTEFVSVGSTLQGILDQDED